MMEKFYRWFDNQNSRVQMTIVGTGIFAMCFIVFGVVAGVLF